MLNQKVDIVIVGAGLVGSAFALWLARHTDLSIALIEHNAPLSEPSALNERVVALGDVAISILKDVGVFSQLPSQRCHAYTSMHVWDEHSDGALNFDASILGLDHLGCMVDSVFCNYLCQQAVLEHSNIQTYFSSTPQALDLTAARPRLLCGQTEFSPKLLVAADGVNSWVRQKAKVFANQRDYQQLGIVTRIETELAHENCAWQRFLFSGPVAILPLADNQSSIVWSADNAIAEDLLTLNDNAFAESLEIALDGRLGKTTVLAQRRAFPLKSLRADRYFKRGLVLVGDAAHSIHPMAGQGVNLGFKDILCLGELLTKKLENGNFVDPHTLSRYQRIRQADNNQTDTLMSGLHHVYQSDWPMTMMVRGMGMNLLNRSDMLRKLLARHAVGV